MNPPEVSLWDAIDSIRATDSRYRREAYLFVIACLGATVQSLPAERLCDPERRHLSGQELLRGVVRVARQEFGPLAPTVFREWGVRGGEDVGAMVFQLVRHGQLSARPQDTIDDFLEGPDLLDALAADRGAAPGAQGPRPARPARPELGA
jgi:uncharacterized repeat protein (TIGR04138 family)